MLPRRRSILAIAAAVVLVVAQPQAAVAEPAAEPGPERPAPETGLWIVQLADPPLAVAHARAPGTYLDQLAEQQDALASRMDRTLDREVEVAFTYRRALNGMAVRVGAAEAAGLAGLPGVAAVYPDQRWELDSDVSHELIGSAAVWEGETGPGVGTRGEGVIVGMLDSGVNPFHPSFAATDGDGYTHTNPYGTGTYVGVCDPDHAAYDDICNDKLIGAWNFAVGSSDARDVAGHGSHVGSTIAGNRHEAVVTVGTDEHTRTVQGVAPRANVISYKVCATTSCFSSATVAAVDQAIADGVDVLNFSISGPDNPWNNAVDAAFLAAFEAGIFVSASAGNDGPEPGTVAKTAPWNAAVAATTHDRSIANRLDVTGPDPVPPDLTDLAVVLGDGSELPAPVEAEMRYAGAVDPGNDIGCEPYPAGAFDGAIALVQRGDCFFSDKVDNAADAGAVAVAVFNQYAGGAFVMGALQDTTIPAVMLERGDGWRLRDHLAEAAGPVQVRIGTGSVLVRNEDMADVVGDFSSRGPSQFDLLAPTFAAPGRNILAAGAEVDGDPTQYRFMQGTSMASPFGAGAGALLAALHPDWSPAQIRSALATTADPAGVVKEDGVTPADPLDVGSGRLDLSRAARAGLVLDETHANFVAADPDAGGDPRTLNLPAIVDQHCDRVCTFTRTVTSVAGVEATYTAQVAQPAGATVTVTPAQFTVAPGERQELTVTVDVTGVRRGDWLFGRIALDTGAVHGPGGPPVASTQLPVAVLPAEPELTVDTDSLASSLDVSRTETHTVTIGNAGGAELSWSVTGSGDGCGRDAGWFDVVPAEGTLAPFTEQQIEVTFDSAGLVDGGVFTAGLCLASNDPDQPVRVVPLELTVVPVPVVDVAPGELAAEQPAGTVTGQELTIGNAGWGVLDWTLADPDAGPSDERLQLLRDGVLLVPNSSSANRGVMAFDPDTGDLIDPEFIPHVAFDPESSLYTPKHILPKLDGTGFLMTDQVRWMITEYDLEGNFRGVFAPVSGVRDPETMANIRGMAWSPWGTLLVTVASQDNADAIVELDADGTYLGRFIEPGQDGLDSPWFILFRDDDVLVSASDSDAIHSFSRDGTRANARFAELGWPSQLVELDNGNILTVDWSGSTRGVKEFDAEGNLLGEYLAEGSSYTGVHPLGNGNILTTTSTGVYEIDRSGEVLNTKFDGSRARYITEVRMPEAQPCVAPGDVPWLSVSAATGATGAGETAPVTVRLDSTGLAPGTYTAQLCVSSDDSATPLVTVPVTLTVTGQACDRTVTGVHTGRLAVTSGLTCLAYGAEVDGPVTVAAGAGLFASGASLTGPVAAHRAASVTLVDSTVIGRVVVTGTTGAVTIAGNQVTGPVVLLRNTTGATPIVVSGNRIVGPLSCFGNVPSPDDLGVPNVVVGPVSGQCTVP